MKAASKRPAKKTAAAAVPPRLQLRLYVAGAASNSVRAISNVNALCREHFVDEHELEIVDMLAHPARALADGVVVTPTLVRLFPLPVRRIVGSLSATEEVLLTLGVAK